MSKESLYIPINPRYVNEYQQAALRGGYEVANFRSGLIDVEVERGDRITCRPNPTAYLAMITLAGGHTSFERFFELLVPSKKGDRQEVGV